VTRRLYLFDDGEARGWAPFALTRPAGELLFGALLLRERIERALGLTATGTLATPGLEGFEEAGAPPAILPDEVEDGVRILLCSRYVPPLSAGGAAAPTIRLPGDLSREGIRLTVDGRTVGWALPQGAPLPPLDALLAPPASDGRPGLALPGSLLASPWDLMSRNPEQVAQDLERLFPAGEGPGARPLAGSPGVHLMGRHPVSVGDGVLVEPGAILDSRDGPIHLSRGVRVQAMTHLRGPAFVGPGSVLMGGMVEHLSCGPVCKLRGEVHATVVLGFSNKAHDGYLGHAVLGRWVNLGALTTNSDLKNNYGPVRVPTGPESVRDTGLMKVGVFLGDHVKTGIGTLLNTGSVVGAGSNVFGGAMPPKWVPPFSWGAGSELTPFRLEAFLETAEKAMARREMALTPGLRAFLSGAWERSSGSGGAGP
jgi:UDP-N-acetylglucosamine diphosphorylase / glucose-1-phosphate thymidylyltransferase / UDP-N-acetylgalactosamine diphosphorylase / glucosamine-1-phosphate N-acetyltransferase / galactosamine-1-phosphate N-acetyltransferase